MVIYCVICSIAFLQERVSLVPEINYILVPGKMQGESGQLATFLFGMGAIVDNRPPSGRVLGSWCHNGK